MPDDTGDGLEPFDVGTLLVAAVIGAIVLFALTFAIGKAFAHQAASGWQYPASCCSGRDCAEIAPASVRDTPFGYDVIVAPGSHPMWRASRAQSLRLTVPYARAQPSPDGRWHLCINSAGSLLCFFATPGGM